MQTLESEAHFGKVIVDFRRQIFRSGGEFRQRRGVAHRKRPYPSRQILRDAFHFRFNRAPNLAYPLSTNYQSFHFFTI